MNISINFHLFNFKNTMTLPNGEEKVFIYQSHGGRLTILWLIVSYIISLINTTEFSFWSNFRIGFAIAIVWDIITIAIYFLRIKLYQKKLMKELSSISPRDMILNESFNVQNTDLEENANPVTIRTSSVDEKIKAIEEEFAESFEALEKMEQNKKDE